MEDKEQNWDDVSKIETQSETVLEDDKGTGKKVVIRVFEFKANQKVFKAHTPSTQELFDYHAEALKVMLWADGLQVMPDVEPRVMISKNKKFYRIYVGAEPRVGQTIIERTKTLADIAHDR